MIIRSMRWRTQLWLAFLLVCMLSGFGVAVYQLQRLNHFRQIDEELESRLTALSRVMRTGPPSDSGKAPRQFENPDGMRPMDEPMPPPGNRVKNKREKREPPPFDDPRPPDNPPRGRPPPDLNMRDRFESGPGSDMRSRLSNQFQENNLPADIAALFFEAGNKKYYYAVWFSDKSLCKASTNAPSNIQIPTITSNDKQTNQRMNEDRREVYYFNRMSDCILVGRSISEDLKALKRLEFLLWVSGFGILGIGLGGTWWLAKNGVKTITEISSAAKTISEGNLSERIISKNADTELVGLVEVLNSTFARLEESFTQQKLEREKLAKTLEELKLSTEEIRRLQEKLQTVCAWTNRIKVEGAWIPLDQFLQQKLHINITHGISPEAEKQVTESLDELLEQSPKPDKP